MRFPIVKNAFVIALVALAFALSSAVGGSLLAQEGLGKGRINGTVTDESDNPLEGVKITVKEMQTGTVLEGVSDKKGHFAVAGMGTGLWKVTATKQGYGPSEVNYPVRQLTRNPPITFKLKKLTGLAGLMADEDALKMFDEGNALLKEGKPDEALTIFEDFRTKYPEVYQIHIGIGSCYLKKDDPDKAEAEFSFVLDKIKSSFFGDLKRVPQTALLALSGLGEVYLKKNDFEKASEYFKQAVDLSPQDEVAAFNVAEVFFSHQKIDEAIRYFELAVQIKPDWPKPHLKLGYARLNKGDYDKAIVSFNRFLELDPENPEAPGVKNIIATIEKLKK